MKRLFGTALACATLLVSMGASAVFAAEMNSDSALEPAVEALSVGEWQCVLPPRGGGEVPSPFAINQHVELAVGEVYSLYGTIVSLLPGGVPSMSSSPVSLPYLQVDLAQHPWLASAMRKNNPYYQVEGGWSYWNRFVGKKVRVTAQAKAAWASRTGTQVRYELVLHPVEATPTAELQTELTK